MPHVEIYHGKKLQANFSVPHFSPLFHKRGTVDLNVNDPDVPTIRQETYDLLIAIPDELQYAGALKDIVLKMHMEYLDRPALFRETIVFRGTIVHCSEGAAPPGFLPGFYFLSDEQQVTKKPV